MKMFFRSCLPVIVLSAALVSTLHSQTVNTLPDELRTKVDATAEQVLKTTGAPSLRSQS